jgi:hypothetical protein
MGAGRGIWLRSEQSSDEEKEDDSFSGVGHTWTEARTRSGRIPLGSLFTREAR